MHLDYKKIMEQYEDNNCIESYLFDNTENHDELYSFALYCREKNKFDLVYYLLVELVERDYPAASFLLGYMYESGQFIEHDNESLKCYMLSKRQGHTLSSMHVLRLRLASRLPKFITNILLIITWPYYGLKFLWVLHVRNKYSCARTFS
ncbi:hypothetical protein HWQ46_25990 [Shewanella sp. D64]|uniref:hypothetical protein n=1 Tax=unclassified Shewanella TaxID=196818 RepID=UPI0022BA21EF|nr:MULTISPECIES: hypothetical protein [unclassified Shewanella]MEC4728969.1 hypothetical protein [Shewanella sp. D64]MEC4740800.1 hypothetical protein [Shewanella sp. E94]WBJ96681.1 hypothetical protein HWQ47_06075 [Shewanella sp. MTB7]